jgi:hypothetical protein
MTPSDLEAGIDWNTVKGANGVEPSGIPVLSRPRLSYSERGDAGQIRARVSGRKWNFDNDPDDPGGPTNMGITQADLARWRKRPASVD